jgi:hypothetical protein
MFILGQKLEQVTGSNPESTIFSSSLECRHVFSIVKMQEQELRYVRDKENINKRSEVITAVKMSTLVFRTVTPCGLVMLLRNSGTSPHGATTQKTNTYRGYKSYSS